MLESAPRRLARRHCTDKHPTRDSLFVMGRHPSPVPAAAETVAVLCSVLLCFGLLMVRRSKADSGAEGTVRYLPRAVMEALAVFRSEEVGAKDPMFGLSGRQIGRRFETRTRRPAGGRVFRALPAGGAGRQLAVHRDGDPLIAAGDGEKWDRGHVPRGVTGEVQTGCPCAFRPKAIRPPVLTVCDR